MWFGEHCYELGPRRIHVPSVQEKQLHSSCSSTVYDQVDSLSPLTSHLSPLTSHLSPLTSHLSPLTSHLSHSSIHFLCVLIYVSLFSCTRFHSFYPWHKHSAYSHLLNNQDVDMLKWVLEFNQVPTPLPLPLFFRFYVLFIPSCLLFSSFVLLSLPSPPLLIC